MAIKSPKPNKKPNNFIRLSLFWAIIVFGLMALAAMFVPQDQLKEVAISDVINRANSGEISKIEIQGNNVLVTPKGSDKATDKSIKEGTSSIQDQGLDSAANVEVKISEPSKTGDTLW